MSRRSRQVRMAALRLEPISRQSSFVRMTSGLRFVRERNCWSVTARSSRLRRETSANRRRSFSKQAGLDSLLELHGPAWHFARAFDLLISRMLEYADAMPTLRRGLSWGVCLVAIFAVGCAGNKKWATTPKPAPAPVVAESAAPPPVPKSDPVADVIAQSDQHFETGRKELE